jgi:hypothetical protein
MRNQGNVQRFKDPVMLVQTLLSRVAHPVDLMMIYGTPAFGSFVPERASLADDAPLEDVVRDQHRQSDEKAYADTEQFLISVARSVGRLKRMGVPDVLGAARILLRDWSHAVLGYYAVPHDRAKHVLSHGSSQEKKIWTSVAELVDQVKTVLPRRDWRQNWASRELRLVPLKEAPFEQVDLVFAPVPEDADDDDIPEFEDEEIDSDEADGIKKPGEDLEEDLEEDDDEDDLDEDDLDEDDLDENLDEEDFDDEDLDGEEDQEDEEEDEIEPVVHPSKKRTSKKRSAKPITPKRAAKTTKPSSRKAAPKPGEAYDINAYF